MGQMDTTYREDIGIISLHVVQACLRMDFVNGQLIRIAPTRAVGHLFRQDAITLPTQRLPGHSQSP